MRRNFVWAKMPGLLVLLATGATFAGTNELSTALSKALFEEEANHNLDAAIRYYQSAIEHFDTDRKLAATAVFRLGECYRKQNSTNEAKAQYRRILQDFADQNQLVTLSRQYLGALGSPASEQGGGVDQLAAARSSEGASKMVDLGEISRVRAIIDSSPDLINAPDQTGRTLLQTYAGKGDVEVMKLLLASGAAVNGIKQPDLTPLHFAAGNGHKAAVELLLSKGAKVDPVTGSGVTPLHLAVLKGYELVAKVLLDAGANAKAAAARDADSSSGDLSYTITAYQTPLHLACAAGYGGLVDLLISKGADVNAQDGKGRTPLTVAVEANNEDMVKALLAAHADPNAGRSSALNLAAGRGSVPLLDLLVTHGAKLDLTDALREAVEKNHPAAVSKLIQLKADPNAKFATGIPVIFSALSSPELMRALLDGGADPNQRGSQGEILLGRATGSESSVPVLGLLLEHGADPNAQDTPNGWTALHYAVGHSRQAPAEVLLKHNANINAQSKNGETPLHLAVRSGNQEFTTLLLEHGADPNLQDHNGQTPLDLARQTARGVPPQPMVSYRLPGSLPSPAISPSTMQELLLQHGASADLPRMDRIEVRRFPNYSSTVFSRSINDINRFSLLELLAAHYGFIAGSPWETEIPNGLGFPPTPSLPFPNLKKIEVRHAKPGGTNWTTIVVSAEAILESGDCSGDVWLNWGDQVEISETDHPVSSQWPGFSTALLTNLLQCVKRTVSVTVKGQTNSLSLEAVYHPVFSRSPQASQFFLLPVLQNSKLLRISSDLSRVKVTRHSVATGENWEKTFDCSGTGPALWLRDGDRIEVPDKP
jgi:ankyrin repeat protein